MSGIGSYIGQLVVNTGRGRVLFPNHLLKSSPLICQRHHFSGVTKAISNQKVTIDNKLHNTFGINQMICRSLYSPGALGLYKLDNLKENRAKLYEANKERYIARLTEYIEGGNTRSILKDDLINLIALAENEQHLELIEKVVSSFDEEQSTSVGSWGSALMRLYYKMNQLDKAYNNIKDVEKFGNFFNQMMSYQIVMSMLFNAAKYHEVIEIYELACKRLDIDNPSKRRLTVLAFATYAKMNTPEALVEAEKLHKEDPLNMNHKMRSMSFIAYLALNQDKPAFALNILSDSPAKRHIMSRELKTLSLIKLKRYEDVLYHLRQAVESIKSTRSDELSILMKDTYDLIEKNLGEIEDENIRQELMDTLVELKQNKLVGESSLESLIFKEILFRNDFYQPYQRFYSNQERSDGFKTDRPNHRSENFGGRFERRQNDYRNRGSDQQGGENGETGDFHMRRNEYHTRRDNNFTRRDNDFTRRDNDFTRRDHNSIRRDDYPRRRDDYPKRRDNTNYNSNSRPNKSYFEDDLDDDLDQPDIQSNKKFR